MTDAPEPDEDLWAWLHAQPSQDGPDWADVAVTAVVEPVPGGDVDRCRQAVLAGAVEPEKIRVTDATADLDGDWLWLLPADTEPSPAALQRLLVALARRPELDIIGPLLIEPRRRGPGTMIREFGQTITSNGRVRGLVPPGELYQGQLQTTDCLAVDAAGMLVRGEVWRELGGFNRRLPASHRGVEFCWRATLAGHQVAAEPDAQVVSRAEPDEVGESRAAGLAIVAAHLPRGLRWPGRLRLVLMSLLAALGYALGKDGERAVGELLGLGRWLQRRELRRSLAAAVREVPATPQARARVRSLRPGLGAGLRRFAEGIADRVSDWVATFTGPAEAPSLDEMTGDEFAGRSRTEPRVSALVAGGVISLGLAVASGRVLFGGGSLQAERLLPAPAGWLDLLGSYLDAVPGSNALNGPAWTGLAALASFVTAGRPEILVSVLLMACIPLAWFAAFRFLRQVTTSATLAALGAFCYALAPAVTGGLNVGAVGVALWTVLLPVFAYGVRAWLDELLLWRRAASTALWGVMLVALAPLSWLVILAVAVVVALRIRSWQGWAKAALVVLAPLLLVVGPWRETVLAYPGRLLTGIDPSLNDTAAVDGWLVLLGRATSGAPPLWLSVVVMAGLWVVAIAGALRRSGAAAAALAAAATAAILALGLTRLLVWAPPGGWARPDALEWQVAMVGGLVLAGAIGLDGIGEELRGATLGLRHLGTLGLIGVTAAVIALAGGWWVVAGEAGLYRGPASALPPFVRNAQLSDTPGRTLALEFGTEELGWSLLEGDLPRFGDVERGLVFSGDPAGVALASSVAARLATGTSDDALLGDLRSLGVGYVWARGADAGQRLAISNTPGLGVGTSDGDTTVWPVPDSGLAVAVSDSERTVVGNGVDAPAAGRLDLAQPPDPRWRVSVGGRELPASQSGGPGVVFDQAGASGTVAIGLAGTSTWWAWVQLAGLALLGLLAAPGIRRPGEELGPRRVEAAVSRRTEPPAARRVAGGQR